MSITNQSLYCADRGFMNGFEILPQKPPLGKCDLAFILRIEPSCAHVKRPGPYGPLRVLSCRKETFGDLVEASS